MAKPNPNRLLVEGDEDKRVIPYFMENFIAWGNDKSTWPVEIESFNGYEDILKPGVIEAELKTPGLKALGIIMDANNEPTNRWTRIRSRSLKAFPDLPEDLPDAGLIWQNGAGLKLGVWLMPDNKAHGMLETFLSLFIPAGGQPLWTFVKSMCIEAKNHNAPYNEIHIDKVHVHAWLAFQEKPGQSLHLAVLAKTLKPGSPHADSFVKWFRSLYSL